MQKKFIKGVTLKRRVAQIIDRSYFVRLHMFMILMAITLTGLVCSKLLLLFGVNSMAIRFGIAISVSYFAFFLFIKLWLLYVCAGNIFRFGNKKNTNSSSLIDLDPVSVSLGTNSGGSAQFSGFQGGSSGGGGVGGGFDCEGDPALGTAIVSGSDSAVTEGVGNAAGEAAGAVSGDGEGLGLIAIILLVALVLSVVIAGGYLIWCAPSIMSEAAFQVILATGLAGKVRQATESGWEISIIKSTWWIFLLVLLFSVGIGFTAQKFIPTAITVRDIFNQIR